MAQQGTRSRVAPALQEGTLQPSAPELEEAVLGAILLERDGLEKVSDMLRPEHFYVDANRLIYAAVLQLRNRALPINILMAAEQLKKNGELDEAGGAYHVSQLTSKVASSRDIEHHARVILQKFMLRTYRKLGDILQKVGDEDDVFDLAEQVNEWMAKVNAVNTSGDPVSMAKAIADIADDRSQHVRIKLGLTGIDDCVSMGPGDVTVIGARPAVGKTAVALTIAEAAAEQGHKVLIISLEMSTRQLAARVAATTSGVDSNRITINDLRDEERDRIAQVFAAKGSHLEGILVADRARFHASEAYGVIARAKERYGCEMVIVDYLQLMDGDGDNGHAVMGNITKSLKQATKAAGVRLVELSQLKRRDGADGGSQCNPVMSDLRESGQIEADADMIILLGRPTGATNILAKLEKNKFGPVGSFNLNYNLSTQRIGDAPPAPAVRPAPKDFTEPVKDDGSLPF